ncbi:ribonuclease H-like domain-containing protein [Melanogaster broomeanus]|nr:ribonuclease H-like domain-containing protein [Melanogaster broomeanus]
MCEVKHAASSVAKHNLQLWNPGRHLKIPWPQHQKPIVPIGKRKKTLDGYVDYPLTKDQTSIANSLLLSEAVRVQQEEINRLKGRKKLTLLLDGWEDLLKRSLYGSVAVEVNQHPVVLSLDDMAGNRGNADNLVSVTQKAMNKMEIGDGKNIIAVTTDNLTVMQAYRISFSLNTLIGEIVAYPLMKKVITQTTRIATFFTSSHYWGGQLNDEAKLQGIKQRLKQNCESRFYTLILHCLSVLSHKNALYQVCLRPGAQRKINNESPVASNVVETVLHDRFYWKHLEQLVKTTKFLVDAIGNVESRQASLADCMLELIRCAKRMSQLQLDPDDNVGFWQHAKAVFNRRFHATNTDYHSLALFLHPICRKLAISQAASGRSIEHMIKIALGISMRWNWTQPKAAKLVSDMQTYNLGRAPFAGGQADGLAMVGKLTSFAITILSIVPHAGEVERLFSALGSTQSPRRCNLSVDTFETLGKIRANLNHHLYMKKLATGQQTRRQHAHMHTREEPGINVEVMKDLRDNFTWVPPLSALSDDELAGPETISLDEIEAEFAALEEQRKEGAARGYGWEGRIVPRGVDDEIIVVEHGADGEKDWDIAY